MSNFRDKFRIKSAINSYDKGIRTVVKKRNFKYLINLPVMETCAQQSHLSDDGSYRASCMSQLQAVSQVVHHAFSQGEEHMMLQPHCYVQGIF